MLGLVLAPLVAGQAAAYDPLTIRADVYPTAAGGFAYDPPPAGAIAFPASDPAAPPSALALSMRAPIRFRLDGGFDVTLQVEADKPLVARDQDGNAFELTLLVDGKPASEAKRVPLSAGPVLAPSERASAHALLPAPATLFSKGSNVTLLVKLLLPAVPEGALKLLVGAGASKATLDVMRVPTVEDLELEDAPFPLFLPRNASFAPADGGVVRTVRVGHASADFASPVESSGRRVYLVFVGDEPLADAQAAHAFPDRERRIDATHQFTVGGLGTLVRVHPGVAVVVPIGSGPAPVEIACARNCPAVAGGWRANVTFAPIDDAPGAPQDGQDALIPPPRSTDGIPTSQDAPEKRTPDASWGLVAASAALAAAAFRRRK
jgi:hypothetical protein